MDSCSSGIASPGDLGAKSASSSETLEQPLTTSSSVAAPSVTVTTTNASTQTCKKTLKRARSLSPVASPSNRSRSQSPVIAASISEKVGSHSSSQETNIKLEPSKQSQDDSCRINNIKNENINVDRTIVRPLRTTPEVVIDEVTPPTTPESEDITETPSTSCYSPSEETSQCDTDSSYAPSPLTSTMTDSPLDTEHQEVEINSEDPETPSPVPPLPDLNAVAPCSALKRSHSHVSLGGDEFDGPQLPKRKSLRVVFRDVNVFYFSRSQGFNGVPSEGGSTLGMSRRHCDFKTFSLLEHEQERKRCHREFILKKRKRRLESQSAHGHSADHNNSDTEEESADEEEDFSDISDSEIESDPLMFVQPVSVRERRAMLRSSGIRKIDTSEKYECNRIRDSREQCGCDCRFFCDPATCQCALAGIKCQVDRLYFPCGCTGDGCHNVAGRIEFNPDRVKRHFDATMKAIQSSNPPEYFVNASAIVAQQEQYEQQQYHLTHHHSGYNPLYDHQYYQQQQNNNYYHSGFQPPLISQRDHPSTNHAYTTVNGSSHNYSASGMNPLISCAQYSSNSIGPNQSQSYSTAPITTANGSIANFQHIYHNYACTSSPIRSSIDTNYHQTDQQTGTSLRQYPNMNLSGTCSSLPPFSDIALFSNATTSSHMYPTLATSISSYPVHSSLNYSCYSPVRQPHGGPSYSMATMGSGVGVEESGSTASSGFFVSSLQRSGDELTVSNYTDLTESAALQQNKSSAYCQPIPNINTTISSCNGGLPVDTSFYENVVTSSSIPPMRNYSVPFSDVPSHSSSFCITSVGSSSSSSGYSSPSSSISTPLVTPGEGVVASEDSGSSDSTRLCSSSSSDTNPSSPPPTSIAQIISQTIAEAEVTA